MPCTVVGCHLLCLGSCLARGAVLQLLVQTYHRLLSAFWHFYNRCMFNSFCQVIWLECESKVSLSCSCMIVCMFLLMHDCVYVPAHEWLCVCSCSWMIVCMKNCMYGFAHEWLCAWMLVCMNNCVHGWMIVYGPAHDCMYVCMYASMFVCMNDCMHD